MTGTPTKKLPGVLAMAATTVGAVAAILWTSSSAPSTATEIGEARVGFGSQSARVVEAVDYRDGVTRVADLIVDNGNPVGQLDDPDVATAWDIVESVWPSSMRADLDQISIIDEGPRGLVGVVHRSSSGGWILSLDRSDLGDRILVEETIIHEIAHMATLGPDQFTFDLEGDCAGVRISVGCAVQGSLMARWAATFWPGGVDDSAPSGLVDEYAATAPHEDLAETFTAWVAGWPVETSHVKARIEMLAADPMMSALASEIRDQRS